MDNKAVFLDRDGVINKNIFYDSSGEWESPRVIAEFEFINGSVEAMRELQDLGYRLFIATNQPSYAKGKTGLKDLQEIITYCENSLRQSGVFIEKTYCSFNHPKSIVPELAGFCKYRKPSAGALLEAQAEFGLDMAESWMIGDRATDIECGNTAGVHTIRVSPDYEQQMPDDKNADFNAFDMRQATEIIRLATSHEPLTTMRII